MRFRKALWWFTGFIQICLFWGALCMALFSVVVLTQNHSHGVKTPSTSVQSPKTKPIEKAKPPTIKPNEPLLFVRSIRSAIAAGGNLVLYFVLSFLLWLLFRLV